MGVITRSIFNGLILAVMVTGALLTVSGYAFLKIGAEGAHQTQQTARARGVEIANALAAMAGERFDRDMAVKLSSVMHQVVLQSNQENTDFIVDEILLLNATNDLMAHNDVALLAEDAAARADFDDDKYMNALTAPLREPTRVDSIETTEFAGIPLYGLIAALSPANGESLGGAFPEKITTRTHISSAVFPVDQELPAGAIHMFVTHKSTNQFVTALRQYTIDTLIMIAAFVFLITFIMILLMSLSFREDEARPRAVRGNAGRGGRTRGAAAPRGKSIVLETPESQTSDDAGLAPPLRETVLNPRPANRSRRRPPLPGPAGSRDGIFAEERHSSTRAPGAPTVDAAYAEEYEDENDDFIDDYEDHAAEEYEPRAQQRRPAAENARYREERLAHNPYEAAGGPAPYDRGRPRIMDAIPLDHFAQNKSAPVRKRSRL